MATTTRTVNSDLEELHGLLIEKHQSLFKRLGETSDPQLADTITREMREVLHRIDIDQSLLFTKASDQITASVKEVRAASDELTRDLQSINDLTSIVEGCSKFLASVDKALDLAKTII